MDESIHILVVDDNTAMAETLADILEAKGFSVHAATSGKEALETLLVQPVDILLTDVKMPEMNGLELFREARKAYPNLVTVFMTAYAADELIQQGMTEGVKTVLTKPLDIKFMLSFFSAVKRIIDKTG